MVSSGSDDLRGDFGSHPSDRELIMSYLRPRITSGGNSTWDFIHDADVYAYDPADLTKEFHPAIASDGEKAWYFFTLLRSKNRRGRRKARTVGSGEGCWHSEHAAKAVVAGVCHSRQIGRRQSFSFMKKEDGQWVRSGWIMVEICLNHGEGDGSTDEIVLCKVYPSPRWAPARGVKTSAAAASAGCKSMADDKNSGAARQAQKCSQCRCRTEPAESQSEMADNAVEKAEPRGRSKSGILEDDSMANESGAPHGDETGDYSENRRNHVMNAPSYPLIDDENGIQVRELAETIYAASSDDKAHKISETATDVHNESTEPLLEPSYNHVIGKTDAGATSKEDKARKISETAADVHNESVEPLCDPSYNEVIGKADVGALGIDGTILGDDTALCEKLFGNSSSPCRTLIQIDAMTPIHPSRGFQNVYYDENGIQLVLLDLSSTPIDDFRLLEEHLRPSYQRYMSERTACLAEVNSGLPLMNPGELIPAATRQEETREKYFLTTDRVGMSQRFFALEVEAPQGLWKPRSRLGWVITDKSNPSCCVAYKMTYDFYTRTGHPSRVDTKTNWIMNVYALLDRHYCIQNGMVLCHVLENNSPDYDPRPKCARFRFPLPGMENLWISFQEFASPKRSCGSCSYEHSDAGNYDSRGDENGQSRKRTRTSSDIWQRFTKIFAHGPDGVVVTLAACNHCCKVLTGDSKQGTSHLRRHKCPCNH